MIKTDTIAAVTTGSGKSAIGIIRISGEDAIEIADKVFQAKSGKKLADTKTYTAMYGHIVEDGSPVDEVIALVMRGPHTYTTEDTVEFDCHGGNFVMKKVMEVLLKAGVRPAEPGEFTKRAFLGGRIDMTEAEAVMDVIDAENDKALKASLKQLKGDLHEKISGLREKILYQTAYIESALDDPENYSLEGFDETLSEIVGEVRGEIEKLLKSSDEGRLIREGIVTAIVGRPNVGKSSVLNLLLGEERAIVTNIEGTTRDTLEEYMNLGSCTLKLIDTAGIRDTEDIVEKIGVDKARSEMEKADLILFIIDGSEDIREEDEKIAEAVAGRNVILLVNKEDQIGANVQEAVEKIQKILSTPQLPVIYLSAKEGTGLEELKSQIESMFFAGDISYNDQIYITSARHKSSLISAEESLARVQNSIDEGLGEDFYTIDLMAAYEALGEIIGETLEDDLADKIFSEFCMGK